MTKARVRLVPRHLGSALVAAVCCAGVPAWGADAVTDAMQSAYAPYRAALFRTNSKAQAESEQAISAARKAWGDLAARYASQPPAPYDRDRTFAASLAEVDKVYAKAAAQIGAGQLPEAHETLEKARDVMAELRRRNGVVTYSDHMNAYHEAMEHVLIDGSKSLAQPGGLLAVAGQAGVLDYLAQRLRSEAPAALKADAEFTGLLDGLLSTVNGLRAAIARQDEAAVRDAIGKLKGPYSRLFLKFG